MDKIQMIKEVRNLTGRGLWEAKDAVEAYQAGDLTEKELMQNVETRVANNAPRSEDYRQYCFNTIRQMLDRVHSLEEYLGTEWDDFTSAREAISELDRMLPKLSGLISKLEDILSEED